MENRERLVSRAQDYYLEKHRELQRQEDDIEESTPPSWFPGVRFGWVLEHQQCLVGWSGFPSVHSV